MLLCPPRPGLPIWGKHAADVGASGRSGGGRISTRCALCDALRLQSAKSRSTFRYMRPAASSFWSRRQSEWLLARQDPQSRAGCVGGITIAPHLGGTSQADVRRCYAGSPGARGGGRSLAGVDDGAATAQPPAPVTISKLIAASVRTPTPGPRKMSPREEAAGPPSRGRESNDNPMSRPPQVRLPLSWAEVLGAIVARPLPRSRVGRCGGAPWRKARRPSVRGLPRAIGVVRLLRQRLLDHAP